MEIIINEIRTDENGRKYNYIEYDKKLTDGTPYSESRFLPTDEEIAEQAKQQRIAELKEIITNKNYLGDDVTEERAELRELLGM
jgi:hypothetical protein